MIQYRVFLISGILFKRVLFYLNMTSNNNKNNIHELLVRKFAGETTSEEDKVIENWITQSRENKNLFSDLNDIWHGAASVNDEEEYDVDQAIRNFIQRTRSINEKRNQKFNIKHLLRYAAIFILIMAIPFTYWIAHNSASQNETFTTIDCAYGDKTTILLPDSSQVWLNSGSKITFNNNFKNGSRQLFLEGEGYFSVRKDPENPFVVNTSVVDVKVLGTEFNLKAYSDEKLVAVTLVNGSLQVSNSETTEMITPGQKAVYNKENYSLTVNNLSDLAPETEWINGRLVFRNASLGDLERQLERWFDVEIEFSDEMVKSRRFSGTLERESILEVISYFGISQYVDYKIKGNIITFFSEKN